MRVDDGVPPWQIAVLTGVSLEKSAVWRQRRFGNEVLWNGQVDHAGQASSVELNRARILFDGISRNAYDILDQHVSALSGVGLGDVTLGAGEGGLPGEAGDVNVVVGAPPIGVHAASAAAVPVNAAPLRIRRRSRSSDPRSMRHLRSYVDTSPGSGTNVRNSSAWLAQAP